MKETGVAQDQGTPFKQDLISVLFVPANRPERFAKAAASGASAVVLDLEDAVAAADKDAARIAIRPDLPGMPCIWRINPIGTQDHADDLGLLARGRPDAILLPKAEAGVEFDRLCATLPGLPVFVLIETAAGLTSARALAAHPAVIGLAFGTLDFCADIGADHIAAVLDPARLELVLAARLAGIARPLDGVTTDVRSPGRAHMDAQHARSLGMGGKLAIHPTQIGEIQDAFRPTPELVDWARRIMAADPGVSVVDGQMVDAPVKARASRILRAAS